MHLMVGPPYKPARVAKIGPFQTTAMAVKHVAIVEDELMVAWSIEAMLEDLGHKVVGMFANGEEAVTALSAQAVDLVCMDINLGGGMDGIEAARRISEGRLVRILFISAYSDATTRQRVLDEVPGARLLGKPLMLNTLEQAIRNIDHRSN